MYNWAMVFSLHFLVTKQQVLKKLSRDITQFAYASNKTSLILVTPSNPSAINLADLLNENHSTPKVVWMGFQVANNSNKILLRDDQSAQM